MRFMLRLGERECVGHDGPDGVPSYPAPELLVRWSSRAAEFPGNLAALLARPPVSAALLRGFSVPLPAGVMRPASLGASLLVDALLLGLLAAISFVFGKQPPTAAELAAEHQRRITWYYFSDELPAIGPLEAPPEAKPREKRGAERASAAPSRQSIISIPAKADNSSQTILQPAAPDIRITRPVPLPNIVMWPSQPARPVLEYLPPPELVIAQAPPRLFAVAAQKPSLEYLPAPPPRRPRLRLRLHRGPPTPAPWQTPWRAPPAPSSVFRKSGAAGSRSSGRFCQASRSTPSTSTCPISPAAPAVGCCASPSWASARPGKTPS